MALDRETLARYGFLQKETVDTQKQRIGIDCCLKKKKEIINRERNRKEERKIIGNREK